MRFPRTVRATLLCALRTAALAFAAPAFTVASSASADGLLDHARPVTVSTTLEYVSKSVQSGESVDVARETGAFALPALREELSATDGRWTLTLWQSRHAGNAFGTRMHRTDFDVTLDRAFACGSVAVNVGGSRLVYPNSDYRAAREGYVTLSFPGPLAPSLDLLWYSYPGEGVYPSFYLNLSRTLGPLELSATLGFYPARTNDYYYEIREAGMDEASFSLGWPIELDESTTLTPSVAGSFTTKRALREALEGEDNVWWGVSLKREFR